MARLESDRFARGGALLEVLDGRLVETDIEIASMFADQFFPAVAQTIAGLAIDVDNDRVIVKQKESVSRVIREGAEARFACAQLVFCLS
jgi:hypothetical protein